MSKRKKGGGKSSPKNKKGSEKEQMEISFWQFSIKGPLGFIGAFIIGLIAGASVFYYIFIMKPDTLIKITGQNETHELQVQVKDVGGREKIRPTLGGEYPAFPNQTIRIEVIGASQETTYRWDVRSGHSYEIIKAVLSNWSIIDITLPSDPGEIVILIVCVEDAESNCVEDYIPKRVRIETKIVEGGQ